MTHGTKVALFCLLLAPLAFVAGAATPGPPHWIPACPAGTHLVGNPPPQGTGLWCETRAGLRHGPAMFFSATGHKSLATYDQGRLQGTIVTWDSQQRLTSRMESANGVLAGAWSRYHPNGAIAQSGRILDGHQTGPIELRNIDGSLERLVPARNAEAGSKGFLMNSPQEVNPPHNDNALPDQEPLTLVSIQAPARFRKH